MLKNHKLPRSRWCLTHRLKLKPKHEITVLHQQFKVKPKPEIIVPHQQPKVKPKPEITVPHQQLKLSIGKELTKSPSSANEMKRSKLNVGVWKI
jgi:hypothetical protein